MESEQDFEKELERRYSLPRTNIDYVTQGGLVDLKLRDNFLSKKILEENKERITKCLKCIQSDMSFEEFAEAFTRGGKQAYEINNVLNCGFDSSQHMTLESWVIYLNKIRLKVKQMKDNK